VQFALAWWLWIDAHAFSVKFEPSSVSVTFGHYVPGLVSSLGLLMVNVVNWRDLGGFNWGWAEDGVQARVRAWLFFALVVCFGGIIAAVWVASVHWFGKEQPPVYTYPGFALIFQNLILFLATMLFRFAKPMDDGNAYSSI